MSDTPYLAKGTRLTTGHAVWSDGSEVVVSMSSWGGSRSYYARPDSAGNLVVVGEVTRWRRALRLPRNLWARFKLRTGWFL